MVAYLCTCVSDDEPVKCMKAGEKQIENLLQM
jgi:hypothetical protein